MSDSDLAGMRLMAVTTGSTAHPTPCHCICSPAQSTENNPTEGGEGMTELTENKLLTSKGWDS